MSFIILRKTKNQSLENLERFRPPHQIFSKLQFKKAYL